MSFQRPVQSNNDDSFGVLDLLVWVGAGTVILILLAALLFGLFAAMNAFGRYQNVANAENQVQVNSIVIAQTDQLVQVEKQKAQIRVADAQGIAQAQKIIDASLTQNYLIYLAIQAQQEMATHDHTATIYIPVGANGIPIVATQPAEGK